LEILKEATGEDFNPNYYIEYLKEKFESIYNIK
jgi:carboxypeptidase Taq